MIREQIADLKKNIETRYTEKIDKLKQEMAAALNSLSKVEETLFGQVENFIVRNVPAARPILHRRKKSIRSSKMPVPRRMEAALEKMQGEFTRAKLFEIVNSDTTGIKNPEGTLSVVFAKLAKEGKVIAVRELRGNIPALYRKASEETVRTTFPSLLQPSIKEGKGGSV